ncbi:MAG TPA: urea carboxylase-associated family protein [Thermohalobaculum sp.]|nr:urea carboxylase-associated family protein [Thermohalobaculum sp.]
MTAFIPATPDGSNASLQCAISADGTPALGKRYTVPARCGVAVRLSPGQRLTVINTHGTQVGDFWAFSAGNLEEYMSMEHVRADLRSIFPKPGDRLVTNRRRPILTFEEDSSPGVHDTMIAACDIDRYEQLGCTGYHDNCTDNLRMALIAIRQLAPAIPAPFNLWMNIPVADDGTCGFLPTVSSPGDQVVFRAEMPCIAVLSACPMDIVPINGPGGLVQDLKFEVG